MDKLISLFAERTGELLGTISETQLQFLRDYLEQENGDDEEYYIQQATIEILRFSGADPELLSILQLAITTTGEADIRYMKQGERQCP